MTSDIKKTLVLHCFLFTMALKGVEPAPNLGREQNTRREQRQNIQQNIQINYTT